MISVDITENGINAVANVNQRIHDLQIRCLLVLQQKKLSALIMNHLFFSNYLVENRKVGKLSLGTENNNPQNDLGLRTLPPFSLQRRGQCYISSGCFPNR